MPKTLKEKITYCAGLLNRSILDEGLKNVILENIDDLSEADVDRLNESLEREQMELAKVEKQLKEVEAPVEGEMERIKSEQTRLASKLADQFAAEIIQEALRKHVEG